MISLRIAGMGGGGGGGGEFFKMFPRKCCWLVFLLYPSDPAKESSLATKSWLLKKIIWKEIDCKTEFPSFLVNSANALSTSYGG